MFTPYSLFKLLTWKKKSSEERWLTTRPASQPSQNQDDSWDNGSGNLSAASRTRGGCLQLEGWLAFFSPPRSERKREIKYFLLLLLLLTCLLRWKLMPLHWYSQSLPWRRTVCLSVCLFSPFSTFIPSDIYVVGAPHALVLKGLSRVLPSRAAIQRRVQYWHGS